MRCAAILICSFRSLDEGIKLDKGVRTAGGGEVVGGIIGSGELGRQIGEISEGEFSRVGLFADTKETDRVGDDITGQRHSATFQRSQTSRVTVWCIFHTLL